MSDKSDLLVAAEVLERGVLGDEWRLTAPKMAKDLRRLADKTTVSRPIDWGDPEILKKLERRDGKPHELARVLCTDAPGNFPIIAMAKNGGPRSYTADGLFEDFGDELPQDLIPISPKVVRKTVYMNGDAIDELTKCDSFCGRDGLESPRGVFSHPVTIEFEVPND